MARHFLTLFLLIVATLAATSWIEDRIVSAYQGPSAAPVDMEILSRADIAGDATLRQLASGKPVRMRASGDELWTLKQLDAQRVIVVKSRTPAMRREPIEWALTFAFYAAIALVLMAWLWPLTRDLRRLEAAVARFGDRSWTFGANIGRHSQVYPLAEGFRRMARRIDELIASHKDMSNALAHEIKTPLARMQFSLELARQANSEEETHRCLQTLDSDIAVIDELLTTTLNYAILERAEVALQLAEHDFGVLLPAMMAAMTSATPVETRVTVEVGAGADHVVCDLQLLETVVRNLVSNAVRYARREVRVQFALQDEDWVLTVDDDGQGIRENDRERAFESFVQLDAVPKGKTGYGLGLAIVRRIAQWHHGTVVALQAPLGGARLQVRWPTRQS